MSKPTEPQWYHTYWIIALAFVFLPPLGLVFFVLSPEVRRLFKVVVFIIAMVAVSPAVSYLSEFYVEYTGGICAAGIRVGGAGLPGRVRVWASCQPDGAGHHGG